ncbi:MAG: hypothetical protein IJ803_03670 [Oribacterium sp.]|nr:hypothetical protein [Oribacterium sp.]
MAKLSIQTLMKLDRDKVMEVPSKEVKAVHLSNLLGEDSYITIKALSGNQYMDLLATARNKKNDLDMSKMFKAQSLIVVEGVTEPSLKDAELQKHFGAASPVDLAQILFPGGELTSVFNEVAKLSGFIEDDEELEEEVKN